MSVTILMPVYNGAAFLARSLKSISGQSYGDWRVVIGDDGSTDDSLAVIERSGLPRLTLRRNARNIGWAQTVNLLLAAKTLAAMEGRDYLIPDDVKAAAPPVLRHRLLVKPEADLEGITPDRVVAEVLAGVEVPK